MWSSQREVSKRQVVAVKARHVRKLIAAIRASDACVSLDMLVGALGYIDGVANQWDLAPLKVRVSIEERALIQTAIDAIYSAEAR